MPDRVGAPPRAWQRMLSGRRLDLLDPSPLDVEISDIALGLARVARWNGQTIGRHAFSVAQHSVVVEQIFGIPGIGQAFVRGALDRDYTLVLGVVILYATLIIGLNLLVDLLYGALDPRVRRQ